MTDEHHFAAFDLETIPAPDSDLVALTERWDFGTPPGNYEKDEAKEGWLLKERNKFIEKAALHAATGQIAIAGILWDGTLYQPSLDEMDEPLLVSECLRRLAWLVDHRRPIVTAGGNHFDMQFLRHRAWILGIDVPPCLYSQWHNREYLDDQFLDLLVKYGGEGRDTIKLHNFALMLGMEPGETTGKDFLELWKQGHHTEAKAHNETHLLLIDAIARRIEPRLRPPFEGVQ